MVRRMDPRPGTLFVYGSFLDDAATSALLGRRVERQVGIACGWSAYQLHGTMNAGAVRDGGEIVGQILTGLSDDDFVVLDDHHEGSHARRMVTCATERLGPIYAPIYALTDLSAASPDLWRPATTATQVGDVVPAA